MANNKYQNYIKRQDEYVESLEKGGMKGFTLIDPKAFVKSMRNSGYKSTATAIDEFIDNSIEAFSKRIDVIYEIKELRGKKLVRNIAIIDNGLGMSPKMIKAAVLWGGTDRYDSRNGMGRFGFGLPSAAISLTNNYEVFSARKNEKLFSVEVDLNVIVDKELKNEDIINYLEPVEKELPSFVKDHIEKESLVLNQGTIVLIKNPDSLSTGFISEQSFHKNLMEHIGVIYRGLLKDCEIYIQGNQVLPTDPLFLMPGGRYYDIGNNVFAEKQGEDEFTVKTDNNKLGEIKIRYSWLPFPDGTSEEEKARYKILKKYCHSYLIVCRAGRQIDLVTSTHFSAGRNYAAPIIYDRNWAIEIDFDPILDEEFGITVNKQYANISEKLWNILGQRSVGENIKKLKALSTNWHRDEKLKRQKADGIKLSEDIAREADEEGLIPKASDLEPEKEDKARKKLELEAKELSDKTGQNKNQIIQQLEDKAKKHPYLIDFEAREGAPFFWSEQFGPQIKIFINTRHRFYSDFYSRLGDDRTKTVIELILVVLGSCEIKSSGKKELFYQSERNEWSVRLNNYLAILNEKDVIEEAEEAEEETVSVSN
jgi:hypothetical protein